MGCACSHETTTDIASMGPQNPGVISEKRSCTNGCFLMLFFAFWVGMIVLGVTAFAEGNTNRILYGMDMSGNICGTNESFYIGSNPPDFTRRRNIYWFMHRVLRLDPTEFITSDDVTTMKTVCLSSCPTDHYMVLQTSTYVCVYNKNWDTDYYDSLSDDKKMSSQEGKGPCYRVLMSTYTLLNKCFPSPPDSVANASAKGVVYSDMNHETARDQIVTSAHIQVMDTGQLQNGVEIIDRNSVMNDASNMTMIYERLTKQFSKARLVEYLADLLKGYMIILACGMGGGMVLSFVWIGLMRNCAGLMTWTTICLTNFIILSFTLFCYVKAGKLAGSALGERLERETGPLPSAFDPSSTNKKVFEILAYVLTGATIIGLVLTVVMRKRIAVAIACIEIASSAVASLPCLLFFPIFPFILCAILVIWWLLVAIYLYTDGQVEVEPNGAYTIHWDNTLRYMGIYHLFGLLWTWQFINGIGDVVIAGAVSLFYWQQGEPTGKPLCTSLKRTFRYHLGTIALGSMIIAVLQFVRLIFEYVKRKTKPMTDGVMVARFVLGMIRCFLWVVEAMLTFVNRNAYIVVAIKGTGYCASAAHAVGLILKNVLRVSTINVLSGVIIFVGQLMVALACGVAAFSICEWKTYSDPASRRYLSSPLVPVTCSAVVGYLISQIFLQVYDMGIDTIMLCFFEDCNLHDNKPLFAPTILIDALGLKRDLGVAAMELPEVVSLPPEQAPPARAQLSRRSSSQQPNTRPNPS